jgi:uncharacterized protein YacL
MNHQTGEHINVRIEEEGKDIGEGIGYLEDRTLVVVGGGSRYLGQEVEVWVEMTVERSDGGYLVFARTLDYIDWLEGKA